MSLIECKCGCGQKIESAFSYKVPVNGINFKFLNEMHYREWSERPKRKSGAFDYKELNDVYDVFIDIFGKEINSRSIIEKEMQEWKKISDTKTIISFLNDKKKYFSDIIKRKNFNSIYVSIKYFSAIIKNELPNYKIQSSVIESGKNEQIVNTKQPRTQTTKKRISLAELEDDL